MKVREIYRRFKVPPNLQEHMLRVAKVALFICNHWQGPKINADFIEKEALLHDLGNIVKCDFQKYSHFLGREQKRVNYWLRIQQEMIAKYGHNDSEATASMLREIDVDPKIIESILAKSFWNILKIEKSENWEVRIEEYADLRVGPFGLISLEERLNEGLNRYMSKKMRRFPLWLRFPKWIPQFRACKRIEKQIQKNCDVDIIGLTEAQLAKENDELLNLEI